MRIAAHAIVAAYGQGTGALLRNIVSDGLTTHGHPHALIGAAIHGQVLTHALSKKGTLDYGELLDQIIEEPAWASPSVLMDTAGADWLDSHRLVAATNEKSPRHPAELWEDIAREA